MLRELDSISLRLRELGTEISEHSTEQDDASSTDSASSTDTAELSMSTLTIPVGLADISAEIGGQGDDGQRRDSRDSESEPTTVSTENAAEEWNAAHPKGPTWEEHLNGYRVGPPDRPHIEYDDDFPFEPKKGEDDIGDHLSLAEWKAKLRGTQLLRTDLDDSLALYEHYLGASGDPMSVDYEEGYQEDASIRQNVDSEILASQASVQQMVEDGQEDFSFTGPQRRRARTRRPRTGRRRWADISSGPAVRSRWTRTVAPGWSSLSTPRTSTTSMQGRPISRPGRPTPRTEGSPSSDGRRVSMSQARSSASWNGMSTIRTTSRSVRHE